MADRQLQVLPSKEASLFKSTLKFYEHKQYKKGLKVCEQILKKCPQNGETLAMKGLFLGNLNRKEEGYECIRQGIKLNIRSHISWHVYGLLYRADKNYEEAMKCYKSALRIDSENMQILRDLAVLQLQMRQYDSHAETRYQLLTMRPTIRASWITVAIAYHLQGKHMQSVDVIDAFLESLGGDASRCIVSEPDLAQIHLYRLQILMEAGQAERALSDLRQISLHNSCLGYEDEFSEYRAQLLLKVGNLEEAQKLYRELIEKNAKSLLIQSYLATFGGSDQSPSKILEPFFIDPITNFPRLSVYRELLRGEKSEEIQFKYLCDLVLGYLLKRGTDSAFTLIKEFSNTSAFRRLIHGLLENTFYQYQYSQGAARLFLAQYFYEIEGSIGKALENLDEALSFKNDDKRCKDPSQEDLLLHYSDILYECGFPMEASKISEHVRIMDLSDRYLNSQSCKYLLRSDCQMDEAVKIASLFLRRDGNGNAIVGDLVEMQVCWYAQEVAESFYRQNMFVECREKLEEIFKFFTEYHDDQFDFHNYAIRRMNLRSYISLLRFEDVIYSQPMFLKAALLYWKCLSDESSSKHNRPSDTNFVIEAFGALSISSENQALFSKWITILTDVHVEEAQHVVCDYFLQQKHFLRALRSLYRTSLLPNFDKIQLCLRMLKIAENVPAKMYPVFERISKKLLIGHDDWQSYFKHYFTVSLRNMMSIEEIVTRFPEMSSLLIDGFIKMIQFEGFIASPLPLLPGYSKVQVYRELIRRMKPFSNQEQIAQIESIIQDKIYTPIQSWLANSLVSRKFFQ